MIRHNPTVSPPRAPELAHDVLDLTPDDARAVGATARDLSRSFVGGSAPLSFTQVALAAHRLPTRIRAFLLDASSRSAQHGITIRGNLVDHAALGPTPEHWSLGETSGSSVHSCVLLLYSALLGHAFGWESQQSGRIVTDVVPSRGFENSLVSASSKLELGWHTEDAFSEFRADRVGLYCLRDAPDAATTVSYARRDQLSSDTVETLSQPRFVIRPDDAHQDATVPPPPMAALVEAVSDPLTLRVDRDFTTAAEGDSEAGAALDELTSVLDVNLYDLPLVPGSLCFLDNRIVVHGRRSFSPRFDGTDRWLKRVNLTADLRRVGPGLRSSGSRVIAVASAAG